jgi:nicotinate-nucleotide adenylyltransferase
MKRIALFFGSFNPIHKGHIRIGLKVLKLQKADEVHFVLTPQNPQKPPTVLWPEEHRWNMLQQALEVYEKLIPNDIELHLAKPSYTSVTLRELTKRHPENHYILLFGADTAINLKTWDNADYLKKFPRLIYPRKNNSLKKFPPNECIQNVELHVISASTLRSTKEREVLNEWIPKKVYKYIIDHKLINDF